MPGKGINIKTATLQELRRYVKEHGGEGYRYYNAFQRKYMYAFNRGKRDYWARRANELRIKFIEDEKKDDYKFTQDEKMGARIYLINSVHKPTTDIEDIMYLISTRVNHAIRDNAATDESNVHVSFTSRTSADNYGGRTFKGIKIKDLDDLRNTIRLYNENVANSQGEDYIITISRMSIKIVKEATGGCQRKGKDIHKTIGGYTYTDPRSTNNNCYFACLKDAYGLNAVTKGVCNNMRRAVNVGPNEPISPTQAVQIYNHFGDLTKRLIAINSHTKEVYASNTDPVGGVQDLAQLRLPEAAQPNPDQDAENKQIDTITIMLMNDHWLRQEGETKTASKCELCLKRYMHKHTCNRDVAEYAQAQIRGRRVMMTKVNLPEHNNFRQVLHYDIESYNRVNDNGQEIQTPYIVGFTELRSGEFQYYAGNQCMEHFINYCLILAEEMKQEGERLYINAYNGAGYDHFMFVQTYLRLYGQPKKMLMNNGTIIGFEDKNMKLFDLCKHMVGSLGANLSAWKCNTLKGDLDHELSTCWEETTDERKEQVLKYLKADVLGLRELYGKYAITVFQDWGRNLTDYISTSALTFNMWKERVGSMDDLIHLPTLKQEKAFRQSVRGGRTYKNKHRFVSEQRDAFLNGDISFDDIKDYLVDADVVSLYPAAMQGYEYPVGEAIETKEYMEGKMGIYYIRYVTNKNLIHSIGGRRGAKGQLIWDLNNSEGWYTSVDIEDMTCHGYQIEVIEGYYWNKTAPIFREFIDDMFKLKSTQEKGSPRYILAKLFMNALYGKMIQRPIPEKSKFISTNKEYWNFWMKYDITEIEQVGALWFVSGVPRDDDLSERAITKPTHLGAFILAYSRRIMLKYINESNPYFNSANTAMALECDFYYTDTDSIQLHQRNAPKFNKGLGGITDDLGDGCKIIRGIWIAPKLYMLEYIKSGSNKLYYHFRGKGLKTDQLTVKSFEDMDSGRSLTNVREFRMQRIHTRRNAKQQEISQFSIQYLRDVTRTVNKTAWSGRCFNANSSVPWGSTYQPIAGVA